MTEVPPDDVMARYPGLAPPTPGGRRSRSGTQMSAIMSHSQDQGQTRGTMSHSPAQAQKSSGSQQGEPNYGHQQDEANYGHQQGEQNYGHQQGEPNYGHQQGEPNYEPHAYLAEKPSASQMPADRSKPDDLNFGWFSVPKPGVKEPPCNKGMGDVEPGSAPRKVSSRTGSNAPRDVPSRTGSAAPRDVPSRTGSVEGRDVPSRAGSNAPRDVPSRTGSVAGRDVPSRAGSNAPRDVPSRTGSVGPCDGQDSARPPSGHYQQTGPSSYGARQPPGPGQSDDDVIIDWPLSSNAQAYITPKITGDPEYPQQRPRTAGSRCQSRSAAPPTPLPPITWGGYNGENFRPTFSDWSDKWRRSRQNQPSVHQSTRCFYTGDDINNSNTASLLGEDDESGSESDRNAAASEMKCKNNCNNKASKNNSNSTANNLPSRVKLRSQSQSVSGFTTNLLDSATCEMYYDPQNSPAKESSFVRKVASGMRKAFRSLTCWPQQAYNFRSQNISFKFQKFQNEIPSASSD